jgi:hypothetical protein
MGMMMTKADILAEIVREKDKYRAHTDRFQASYDGMLDELGLNRFAAEAMAKLEAYSAVIGTWSPTHEEIWSEMDKPALK